MQNTIRTGRPLDVDALVQAKNKVTLGFKCDAQLKMDLALEAEKFGMTLSEYTEIIACKRHDSKSNQTLLKEIEVLRAKVSFYENDLLKKALVTYKGKLIPYKDIYGDSKEIQIQTIEDVYTVFIHTLKTTR
ncbi:hypothetical protein [uncultured Arcticibacterium sp.]|mgnify:CR=1 FL=1|uniref:hypothetical protein n=1 Tax=uncultured Arcticibacterium sp. TaxID=2173042 RepID=UPI0030F7DCE3